MKKQFFQTLILLIVAIYGNNAHAQTLVNKEWEQLNGIPDSIAFSSSTLDTQGNLIVTSNAITTGQQANLVVMKYDRSGTLLWQDTYNGTFNGKDYGIAITTDTYNNVYVAGASQTGVISSDYIIRKYKPNGTVLWTSNYSGSGTYNAPTSIILDNNQNVYVTGVTFSLTTQTDYATLKLDANGIQQWVQTYDYANLYDVPAGIEVNATTNTVYVTGASASTNNNYDYATLEYDVITGNQMNVNRVSAPGTGFDKATTIKRDNAGNIYITGSAFEQSTNSYDIKTIKLNSSLGVQWIQIYDKEGLQDIATTIDVDNSGNVFIAGYVSTSNEGHNFITIKYDANGNLIWKKEYNSINQNDEVKKLDVNNIGDVIVTGVSDKGSENIIITINYNNSDGSIEWIKENESTQGQQNDAPNDIKIDNQGNVYVTGTSYNGANYQNTIIKYSGFEYNQSYEYDNLGNPIYVNSHVIIRFDPTALLTPFLESRERIWGNITDYIKPNAIIQMEEKLGFSLRSSKVIEVFKELTIADSLSITRTNDTIDVPKLWTTLLLVFPNGTNTNIITACQQLNQLKPNTIWYAEPDYIVSLVTNDINWGSQKSLINTIQTPESDINIQPAWDITTGRSDIKIGVSDTGIRWKHEDFNKSPSDTTAINNQIKGGKNYINGNILNINYTPFSGYHGTGVAGIIGAIRNNNAGIAGVAGGDFTTDSTGVSLYDFLTVIDSSYGSIYTSAASVFDAAVNNTLTNPSDLWVHIINCSWVYTTNFPDTAIATLRNAFREVQRNKATSVVGRGNNGTNSTYYPANFKEDWVTTVGGSDSTGNRYFVNPTNGSSWGRLDIVAPFDPFKIYTTHSTGYNSYHNFGGTSAATPHVSGTYGLMLSYFNDNTKKLYPEDLENISEITAYDSRDSINHNSYYGYDEDTGWGRLNAGKALSLIANPNNFLVQKDSIFGTVDTTYIDTIFLDYEYQGINYLFNNIDPLNTYEVEVKRVIFEFDYNTLGLNDLYNVINPDSTTPNHPSFWIRNSASNLWGGANDSILSPTGSGMIKKVLPEVDVEFVGRPTNNHAKVKGYYYKILQNLNGNPVPPFPYNILPNTLGGQYPKTGISILLSKLIVIPVDEIINNIKYKCYPNPTNTSVNFEIESNEGKVEIEIADITGKLLKTIKSNTLKSKISLDISDLSSGIYIYKIHTDNKTLSGKLIKL